MRLYWETELVRRWPRLNEAIWVGHTLTGLVSPEEEKQAPSAPSPQLSAMWGQQPGSNLSPATGLAAPRTSYFQPREQWAIKVCDLSRPVYGIFLQQHKLTNIQTFTTATKKWTEISSLTTLLPHDFASLRSLGRSRAPHKNQSETNCVSREAHGLGLPL